MLDLTNTISLSKQTSKIYLTGRFLILLAFILFCLFAAYRLIFPPSMLNYSASPLRINKNTLNEPLQKTTSDGTRIIFGAAEVGTFSEISANLLADKKSDALLNLPLNVRRSYQTYFYPQGQPIGFRNGNLLTNMREYFIVSDGMLRKFSPEAMEKMGYSKDMFTPATGEELSLTPFGENIDANNYPTGTLFAISDNFFQLTEGKLKMFITKKAFLTQYPEKYAVKKDETFLSQLPVSEEFLGYADGTLLSNPQSVFIVSRGKSYPIDNPITVTALGYSWDDVIAADDDEIGLYEKQKVFSQDQPHPDGVILIEKESGKRFLVWDGKKLPILTESIARSYSNAHPIEVNEASLTTTSECRLNKNLLPLRSYGCDVSIENLNDFKGNEYQFEINGKKIMLDEINVTFRQKLILDNVKTTYGHIKYQLQQSYVRQ